ncbi:TetR/AcrR family transcriptional regulator C-terminal domain-containing protein [Floccifex sp.]|uniref:TetR/AcrR family transcriptional regulator C-terminal domain-containing protein n=1 Tax=Floccifex sp. TaxID=2815810 RepID=UPI003F051A77
MKHEINTYHTKRALADSLKKLMKQKPFSKITVSELAADCGVNRKTFYYHFEDIYSLLKWMFEEDAIEVVKHFDLLIDYEQAIRFVMKYVDENDYIISCAYDSIGRDEIKRFFYTDFIGIVTSVIDEAEASLEAKLDPDFKVYIAKFYTEAISGMLIDWVKEKDRHDREKVVGYLTTIIGIALESMKLHNKNENSGNEKI